MQEGRKFRTLREKMSPESQKRSHEKAKELDDRVCLGQDGRNVIRITIALAFVTGWFLGYFFDLPF